MALFKAVVAADPAHYVRGQYAGYRDMRDLIAKHKVDLSGGDAAERDLVYLSMCDLDEVAHTDFEQDHKGFPDRVLQRVVEDEFGRRQERFLPEGKADLGKLSP